MTMMPKRLALPHLRAWRLSRFWTQQEMATMARISTPTIVRLERGVRPASLATIHKLAHTFGVDPATLVYTHPSLPSHLPPHENARGDQTTGAPSH